MQGRRLLTRNVLFPLSLETVLHSCRIVVDRPTQLICISDIYMSTDKYKRHSREICKSHCIVCSSLVKPWTWLNASLVSHQACIHPLSFKKSTSTTFKYIRLAFAPLSLSHIPSREQIRGHLVVGRHFSLHIALCN